MNGEGQAKVDHSRRSIEHAQHISNFLVDEARLSQNMYEWTNDEVAKLVTNHDVHTVTLSTPHAFPEEKELLDFYRTEMYLFQ